MSDATKAKTNLNIDKTNPYNNYSKTKTDNDADKKRDC